MVSQVKSYTFNFCEGCGVFNFPPEFQVSSSDAPSDLKKRIVEAVKGGFETVQRAEERHFNATGRFEWNPKDNKIEVLGKISSYVHNCNPSSEDHVAALEKLVIQPPTEQKSAEYYIKLYNMQKSIEGGWFGAVDSSSIEVLATDSRYEGQTRSAFSSIYYVLKGMEFSAFHQLASDETLICNDGESSTNVYVIDSKTGELNTFCLGNPNKTKDASFQLTVQAGNWFAMELCDKESFALLTCIVTPGFVPQDFKLADREELIKQYPNYASIIARLTRVNKSDSL